MFFFFQAKDGIRDYKVTGVQTCALPISPPGSGPGRRAFSLEGRSAVVTGARSGIGRAIALGLAEAGANVALWGRSDNLEATARELAAGGRLLRTVQADLGDTDLVDR